ncbi:fibronectin type III domain-containing protein [Catenulispora sp. GAS73]|uniref:fibronectin type III domain-containing protein n=1 Tax=Catenulispora sp. GAS73 TaxID=3156269 RepID=UPI0035189A0B
MRRALIRTLRRDRTAATAAFAALALLAVAVFSAAGAWRAVVPAVRDAGAWLTDTPRGAVVHANGPAGVADARVAVAGSQGHPLHVVQEGGQVVVVDSVTGRVSRIDPSQLTVTQSVDYDTAGVQIVAGAGLAYAIDPEHGVVQQIDLARLSAIGAPVRLGRQLGAAGIDGQGTLWVPVPTLGQLVPVAKGTPGPAVTVGLPGDPVALTIAGGTPVVTDAARGTMTVLGHDGGRTTVNLPAAAGTAPGGWLAPPSTEGTVVPVVVSGGGELIVVDTRSGVPSSVTLADAVGDDLGTPQALGSRVYLPDDTTGQLIVYDTASGQLLPRIQVTDHPAKLLLFVKDGMLWIDDPDGPDAVAVEASGAVHHIGKDGPHLPGDSTPTPTSASGSDSPASASAPTTTGTTSQGPSAGQGPPSIPKPSGDSGTPSAPDRPSSPSQPPSDSSRSSSVPPPRPVSHASTPSTPSKPSTPSTSSSASSPAKPSTPPASSTSSTPPPPVVAPQSVTETPQAGSIRVTFTPVGAGVTDYTLTGLPSGVSVPPVPAGGASYFTVSGLTCSKPYRFGVSANYPTGSATTQATAGALPCVAPNAPRNLTFDTATQHQIGVSWSAPSSDGGASVTYEVSWGSANDTGLTGTSDTISGLTNFQSYLVTVAARNPAGLSQPPAGGSVRLTAGPWPGHITNNSLYPVNERRTPHLSAPVVNQYPAGSNASVSVSCIGPGDTWQDPVDKTLTGSTWYQIAGSNGWVASGYISTATGVWSCT